MRRRARDLAHAAKRARSTASSAPRTPSCFERGAPNVGWLFADPVAAAKDYFKRTGIFPIMHIIGVRRSSSTQHPWLPAAVFKAFERAKAIALDSCRHLRHQGDAAVHRGALEEARALMGEDFWSYGVSANRKTLEKFLRHHHAQGLSSRLVKLGGAVPSRHVRDLQAVDGQGRDIRVFSGGATKELFAVLTPQFEAQSGHKVAYVFAVMSALRDRLAAGEKADVLVMPTEHPRRLSAERRCRAEGRGDLWGSSA